MTVAAIILSARPQGAVELVDGVPRVRRLADVAWAGGAVPIVVVSGDPDGAVAASLAGAPVTLAEPAPMEAGSVGQICRGSDVARDEVRDTDGLLVWPARMQWVDPETITSLIEAHGTEPDAVLRPSFNGEPGWPVLLPTSAAESLRAQPADFAPDDLVAGVVASGAGVRHLELGDPGVTHDSSVARDDMPPFHGPPEPAAGHVHEWGSVAAERPDDSPLEGPPLAPYGLVEGKDSGPPDL